MCDGGDLEGMKMHIKMTNVLQMYFCGINIGLIRIKLRKVIISTLERASLFRHVWRFDLRHIFHLRIPLHLRVGGRKEHPPLATSLTIFHYN